MLQDYKKNTVLPSILAFFIGVSLMWYLEYYFLDAALVIGNLGVTFYTIEIIFVTLNSFLFGSFLALNVYKMSLFSVDKASIGIFWWFLGILVTWCPSCSITLASYIWLASLIWSFPYGGIELKIVAFLLLIYANYSLYKNLKICNLNLK